MRALTKSDVEDPQRLYYAIREIQDHNVALQRNLEMSVIERDRRLAEMDKKIPQPSLIDGVSNFAEALPRLGVDEIATKKSDLVAAVSPGVTDDEVAGYAPGSIKLVPGVTPEVWMCADASRGNAVWVQLDYREFFGG